MKPTHNLSVTAFCTVAKQGNLVLPYVRRLLLKRVFSIKAGVICFFHTADLFGRGGSLDKF